jgi:hypothetical protein
MSFFQAFGLFSLGAVAGSVGLFWWLAWKLQDPQYCRQFMHGFAEQFSRRVGKPPFPDQTDQTVDCFLCGWTNVPPRPMFPKDFDALGLRFVDEDKGDD